MKSRFIDIRDEQAKAIPRSLIIGNRTAKLDWSRVDGITLHQMGLSYGVSDRQLRASGGDHRLAKARRFLSVPAHACVSLNGDIVIHAPIDAYLYHAGPLNSVSLGLEIEGGYAGIEGDRATVYKEALSFEGEVLEASKEALKYLVETGRRAGMDIQFLYAHRQSSATRRGDPGEAIWRALSSYGRECLGLSPKLHFATGNGRPIPKEWDALGKVDY